MGAGPDKAGSDEDQKQTVEQEVAERTHQSRQREQVAVSEPRSAEQAFLNPQRTRGRAGRALPNQKSSSVTRELTPLGIP